MKRIFEKSKQIANFLANPVILVFLLTAASHFFNLFGYPPIEGDEGVYIGQAYWLVNFGKITPYTYWYDHFPMSWLQIGIWQKLTGGPFIFGLSVFSGRVFVALLACLTNVFLFLIAKKLTRNTKIAFLTSLIFAFSPLAIFYHRKVLLDNIAVFWLVLAVYWLVSAGGRLFRFFLAGLFLGIAFLSKESMLFFVPAFLIAVPSLAKRENRSFSILIFLLTLAALISLFPLLALLKGEFFPTSWLGGPSHVSFIETFVYQLGRGNKIPFWQAESDFRANLNQWLNQDFILISLGLWTLLVNLLFGKKTVRLVSIMGLFYLLFLIRGGLILDFYLIPLIPFLVLNLGFALDNIVRRTPSFNRLFERGFIYLSLALVVICLIAAKNLFFLDATQNQKAAVDFVKRELEPESVIVSDFTPWVDLRLARYEGDLQFKNTEWFYKAELDPEIKEGKLGGNYYSIDYLILTHEMVDQITKGGYPLLSQALANSILIKDFPPVIPSAVRDLDSLVSTDGTWVAIYKIDKENFPSSFGSLISSL